MLVWTLLTWRKESHDAKTFIHKYLPPTVTFFHLCQWFHGAQGAKLICFIEHKTCTIIFSTTLQTTEKAGKRQNPNWSMNHDKLEISVPVQSLKINSCNWLSSKIEKNLLRRSWVLLYFYLWETERKCPCGNKLEPNNGFLDYAYYLDPMGHKMACWTRVLMPPYQLLLLCWLWQKNLISFCPACNVGL